MTQLIKFPSIEQFRTIVKHVRDNASYHNVPTPTLTFSGRVKLHGTNASVANDGTGTWAQSRENVITLEKDNAVFAQYVHAHQLAFDVLFAKARKIQKNIEFGLLGEEGSKDPQSPPAAPKTIVIYGEWCGQGIQKGVAVSQIPKMFVVFDARVTTGEDGYYFTDAQLDQWFDLVNSDGAANNDRIFYIGQFQRYNIDIDFSAPEHSQNQLVDLTIKVEDECPVGKHFGVSGVGEGIVWSTFVGNGAKIRFKVKGEKHSVSKVKTLVEVDTIKLANIEQFVERTVTENRLQQMKQKMVEFQLDENEIKNIGQFLKFVSSDIIKEESDVLESMGISNKEVMSRVSRVARDWFIANIKV